MGQSLNDAADGFEAIIEAIDSSILFYSEPEEILSPPTEAGIAAELFFSRLRAVGPADKLFDVDATIEFSTPSHAAGWSAAVRRIRALTTPFGALSVWAAVRANLTLGARVVSALPAGGGSLGGEVRKGYQDGDRWTAEARFIVRLQA